MRTRWFIRNNLLLLLNLISKRSQVVIVIRLGFFEKLEISKWFGGFEKSKIWESIFNDYYACDERKDNIAYGFCRMLFRFKE